MRLHITSRRSCDIERGQAGRMPQNPRSRLVGYDVCCPRCGFLTVAVNGRGGLTIIESDHRTDVTFSTPIRCPYCKVRIAVTAGEIQLIEDAHVRSVRYR